MPLFLQDIRCRCNGPQPIENRKAGTLERGKIRELGVRQSTPWRIARMYPADAEIQEMQRCRCRWRCTASSGDRWQSSCRRVCAWLIEKLVSLGRRCFVACTWPAKRVELVVPKAERQWSKWDSFWITFKEQFLKICLSISSWDKCKKESDVG